MKSLRHKIRYLGDGAQVYAKFIYVPCIPHAHGLKVILYIFSTSVSDRNPLEETRYGFSPLWHEVSTQNVSDTGVFKFWFGDTQPVLRLAINISSYYHFITQRTLRATLQLFSVDHQPRVPDSYNPVQNLNLYDGRLT